MQDKELHQEVHGDVYGDMAGRDVVKHLKVDRVDVQKVDVHVYPPEDSRKVLSKTTLEKVKALMPPVCHDELDWLAQKSDVHTACLLLACKTKALVCEDGHLARSWAYPHYTLGGLLIGVLFAFGAICTRLWIVFHENLQMSSEWVLVGLMSACSLMIYWAQRQYFYSHAVAKKAVAALLVRRQNMSE